MENYVIYIKAVYIGGGFTDNRSFHYKSQMVYQFLCFFLLCIIVETCLAYLFFPAYVFYPACASLVIFVLSWLWEQGKPKSPGENNNPIRLPVQSGISKTTWNFIITIPIS